MGSGRYWCPFLRCHGHQLWDFLSVGFTSSVEILSAAMASLRPYWAYRDNRRAIWRSTRQFKEVGLLNQYQGGMCISGS